MRKYDYREKWKKLLTPEIVSYLSNIHEYKGEQNLFIEAKADTLTRLVEIAKIQSTEASNKIEGIYTSDERLRAIVKDTISPQSRIEKEIAGYRDVLITIHESHDYIPPKPSIILQLHRDLYKFEGFDIGGKYKTSENIIEEEDEKGNKFIRFKPVPAWETLESIEELCKSFDDAMATEQIDPLILIPMFILDFLCIHPFNDGNGRVGRLIMFKECLKYHIVPFIIEDDLKFFYYRGLKEWNRENGYLRDTCLTAQDRYQAYLDYFRISL